MTEPKPIIDKRMKILISGDFGDGKTWEALDFSCFTPGALESWPEADVLSFDYERGQDYYIAPSRAQANREEGLFFVRRLKAPTLYEVKAICEKLKDPSVPAAKLMIPETVLQGVIRRPCQIAYLREPTRQLLADIQSHKVRPTTLVFDTATRLCELATSAVFGDLIQEKGERAVQNMSQLTWSRVKDELSTLFYTIIDDLDLNLIMTSWAKNKFDKEQRKSLDELISDVLKNVRGFVDLEILLQPNPASRPQKFAPPQAKVLKTRIKRLPKNAVLPDARWESIFAAQPKFLEEPEPVAPALDFVGHPVGGLAVDELPL